MAKKAKIYTYSIVYSPSEEFKDKVPYVVAVLEENNERFSTFVEGYKEDLDIKIGMEVEFSRFDEAGNVVYKF